MLASYLVPPGLAYDALMHELGEVVCGDMTWPLKSICQDYKVVEKRCQAALEKRFRVAMSDRIAIELADRVMLATEQRDLMPWHGEEWPILSGIAPMQDFIVP